MQRLSFFLLAIVREILCPKPREGARKDAGLEGPGAPAVAIGENHTLIVARTRTETALATFPDWT